MRQGHPLSVQCSVLGAMRLRSLLLARERLPRRPGWRLVGRPGNGLGEFGTGGRGSRPVHRCIARSWFPRRDVFTWMKPAAVTMFRVSHHDAEAVSRP